MIFKYLYFSSNGPKFSFSFCESDLVYEMVLRMQKVSCLELWSKLPWKTTAARLIHVYNLKSVVELIM